jgi:Arylsulfotransferase (ASST)
MMAKRLRQNRLLLTMAATAALGLVSTGIPAGSAHAGVAAAAAQTRAPDPVPTVSAFPGPGWTTASPQTSIVFRGAPAALLQPLRVVGSRSGVHLGSLVNSRVGAGAVFNPARPFAPGEHVRVTTAERVRGAASTTYRFGVAVPVRGPVHSPEPSHATVRPRLTASAARTGVRDCVPHVWHFRTLPHLHPVADCVSRRAVGTARGLIFTTPSPVSHQQHGPTIFDDRGNVVWYHPMPYKSVHNLSVVTYRNQRLLAVHVQHRRGKRGDHHAAMVLFNHRYQPVARVTAQNGYQMDGHEFQVRGNAAWFGANHSIIDPVSGVPVLEYVVQKVDIRTGELLFEWHSLPQIKTSYSYVPPRTKRAWDYFHGNAIDPLPGGSFLLSGRNTSAVYHISATGKVLWTMGGKHDSFGIAARHPHWQFCFQHDVREVRADVLTVFDNGGKGPGCPRHKARVEEFAYDPSTGVVSRTTKYSSYAASSHRQGYYAWAVGSARFLQNSDLMVSWGTTGRITEFTPTHRVDFDLTLAQKTYRGVRWRWFGNPTGRPAVAASRAPRHVDVYASWNGSTRVARWRVLAGSSRRHLHPVGSRVRHIGFETCIRVDTRARYVAVRAISPRGRVLADSAAVAPHQPGHSP